MRSLDELKKFLLTSNLSDTEIVKAIDDMKRKFTVKRERIGDYTIDERAVSSYAALYLPTNMEKFFFLMEQIAPEVKKSIGLKTFIDFGSGPGTYSLALLDYFKEYNSELILVDSSELMLKQARKLISGLHPNFLKAQFVSTIKGIKGPVDGTLFFGNSINEIGSDKALQIIENLNPKMVIFIEPGTKDMFKETERVREALLKQHYNNLYPCGQNANCPVVKRDGDWCHQVLYTKVDPSIERLCQMGKMDRRTQPLIAHVYARDFVGANGARYLQFLGESKASFQIAVCMNGEHRRVEILKRQFSKDDIKEFRNLSVGANLQLEVEKELKDGTVRAKLIK